MKYSAVCLIVTAALTGCGGGGGSDSSPQNPSNNTPSTPAPVNDSPEVTLNADSLTAKNYEQITISASATDADGIASWDWSVSTEDVILISSSETEAVLDLTGVTEDSDITVTYTATDSTGKSTAETITVSVNSAGALTVELTGSATLSMGDSLSIGYTSGFTPDSVLWSVEDSDGFSLENTTSDTVTVKALYDTAAQEGTLKITALIDDFAVSGSMPLSSLYMPLETPVFTQSADIVASGGIVKLKADINFSDFEVSWGETSAPVSYAHNSADNKLTVKVKGVEQSTDTSVDVTVSKDNVAFQHTFDFSVTPSAYETSVTYNIDVTAGETQTIEIPDPEGELFLIEGPLYVEVGSFSATHTGNGIVATYTAPDVIGENFAFEQLYAWLDSADKFGGLGNISVTVRAGGSGSLVSGNAFFEKVPATTTGLDHAGMFNSPAYGASVIATDSAGTTVARTEVETDGSFELLVPADAQLDIKLIPSFEMDNAEIVVVNTGTPGLSDLTDQVTYYPIPPHELLITSGTFTTDTSGLTVTASADSDGSSLGEDRTAGAFNIINVARTALERVSGQLPAGQNIKPLLFAWSPDDAGDGDWRNNELETCYSGEWPYTIIYVDSESTADSDEYDDTLLAHEIGHYIHSVAGRNDSPGGTHGINTPLDARAAFAEGFANWFSYYVTGEELITNTFASGASSDNFVSGGVTEINKGWMFEAGTGNILFGLQSYFVSQGESADEFGRHVFSALRKQGKSEFYSGAYYFTTIFSFLDALESEISLNLSNGELSDFGVNSVSGNAEGESFYASLSNPDINSAAVIEDYLPVYKPVTYDGTPVEMCMQTTIGSSVNGTALTAFGFGEPEKVMNVTVTVDTNPGGLTIWVADNDGPDIQGITPQLSSAVILEPGQTTGILENITPETKRMWVRSNDMYNSVDDSIHRCYTLTFSEQ